MVGRKCYSDRFNSSQSAVVKYTTAIDFSSQTLHISGRDLLRDVGMDAFTVTHTKGGSGDE